MSKLKAETCNKCMDLSNEMNKMRKELEQLRTHSIKMEIVLQDNGLTDEDIAKISDIEAICVEQLRKYKELSSDMIFTKDEAKVVETLAMSLIRARGGKVETANSKKAKKETTENLLKLIGTDGE